MEKRQLIRVDEGSGKKKTFVVLDAVTIDWGPAKGSGHLLQLQVRVEMRFVEAILKMLQQHCKSGPLRCSWMLVV